MITRFKNHMSSQIATGRIIAQGIHDQKKGQAIISGLIGLLVVVIIGVAVTFPVVVDVVNNSTASGTQRTILNILPLLVLVVIVLAFVAIMGLRG